MSCSLQAARKFGLVALAMLMATSLAFAQGTGSSTTLSGLVVDAQKAVIPGADVVAKNNATGASFATVTNEAGRFTIASVPPGTYTVVVTLMGFKTAQLPDVTVLTATPASVNVTLDVGQLEETVVVTGATEIVQTQSANVATTLQVKQLQQLPVITHTALDAVVSLPGVETSGSNTRGSTINGLPTTAIAITLDGVNVQDKRGSEGFFMYIRPMMDSVEEITVSTSTPGAEASGGGSAVVRMETRAGSNRFSGSVYNTWRNQAGTNDDDSIARKNKGSWLWGLNTPYWFNKRDIPKTAAGEYFINDVRLQTPGFRVGGPIVRDRLFYFFNYEEFRLPESRSRTRYIMKPSAMAGNFTYTAANGTNQTVNLLAIAAANGQTSSLDPSIAKLLADIRTASATTGGISTYDGNVDQYDFVPSATQKRWFPTVRVDYNMTNAHRLTFSYRYNDFNSTPDFLNSAEARFPGFPNLAGQVSGRWMAQGTLRSTFGKSVINEFRFGGSDATGLGTYFGEGVDASQFNCSGLGCQAAGNRGWAFAFPGIGASGLTSATAYNGQSASVAAQWSVENNMTWLKGAHSISVGGNFARISTRTFNSTPTYATLTFGTASLDTVAYNMLDPTSGNFPGGISTTQAGYVRNMYGFLTGRVTNFAGTAYLGEDGTYGYQGERTGGAGADSLGLFVQDSWRWKPNLTLNAGVRYQVQFPMTSTYQYSRPQTWQMLYGITGAGSGSRGQGNLYKPGTMTGTSPLVVAYDDANPAYNTDWNNVAPSVGATWRPNIGDGILSKILSSDPVFRGGYSISFNQLGTSFFVSNYGTNPGRTRAATRSATEGTPTLGVGGWPVLLRDTAKLYPSAFPDAPTYPLTPAINESIDIHYPDWPVTNTHQYSFGIQRELGKSMALDVRYVGNTNMSGWTTFNMNNAAQWAMKENGFYDEYRVAQANLRANIVAGQGNTFAYTGAPGTAPLPIFQAYFAGTPLADAANKNPANYTSANYRASSWYNNLAMYQNSGAINSAFTGIAGTGTSGLQNGIGSGAGLDANRVKAGLPINFFMPNPAVAQGNAYMETNGGNTRYNAMQIELRRRMSQGLLVQGSYSYAFGRKTWRWDSLRDDSWHYVPSTGAPDHAFKLNWVYELPFGQGKKWGSGAGTFLNAIVGGWEWDGVARVQTGDKFNYGGFRLVGMSDDEFQDIFKFYHETGADGKERIYLFPQDVIQNSILALYTGSATSATGYSGASPTGRYIAPASSPDCVQYLAGSCPGTAETRIVTGPMYWKVDMSFVKRFQLPRRMVVEARMDLFNVFDTINFTANGSTGPGNLNGMGSTMTAWQVTAAATDVNASQDPGGRITSFGLRFTW